MRAVLLGIGMVLVALVSASPFAQAESARVGFWKLDEGQGITVADSSGYGNPGTLSGNVAWASGALGFNGSTGYVRVPDNSSLEPPTSVSVTAWFEHAGSPGAYRYLVAKGAAGCIAASYGLYTGPTGGLEFYVSRNRGTVYARSPDAGAGIWDGGWHLAVGTFNGTTVRLYIDGREVGSGTFSPGSLEYPLASSNDLFIGDYPGCSGQGYNFAGEIRDVEVWNQALSASTASLIAQGDQSPPVPSAASPVKGSGGSGPGRPGSGAQGPGAASQGGNRPALKLLLMAPARFTAGGAGQSGGTEISYTATQAGRSTFTVLLRRSGTEKEGRCVPTRPGGRPVRGAHCFRYVPVGQFTHRDRAGVNHFRFSGHVAGRRLHSGAYLLTVIPKTGGRPGNAASFAFQVR